jgi:hypothetical protein
MRVGSEKTCGTIRAVSAFRVLGIILDYPTKTLSDIPQERAGIRYIPHLDAITSFMLLQPMDFGKPVPMRPGPVNLPNGSHAKTGRFSLALFPGAFPLALSPGAARRCPVRRSRAT